MSENIKKHSKCPKCSGNMLWWRICVDCGYSLNDNKNVEYMPKTVWKYTLKLTDFQDINVPEGAKFLTVQNQNEVFCIIALVNPGMKKQKRLIRIARIGDPIGGNENLQYIGTVQMPNRNHILNVFEYIFKETQNRGEKHGNNMEKKLDS